MKNPKVYAILLIVSFRISGEFIRLLGLLIFGGKTSEAVPWAILRLWLM